MLSSATLLNYFIIWNVFSIVSLALPRNKIIGSTNNNHFLLPLQRSFSCLIALAGTPRTMLYEHSPSLSTSRSVPFLLILSSENYFFFFGLVISLDGHTNMSS